VKINKEARTALQLKTKRITMFYLLIRISEIVSSW